MRRSLLAVLAACSACSGTRPKEALQEAAPVWELANPIRPLPASPLGIDMKLTELPEPPKPERVRLGRWLYYDTRLSADGSIACASCHKPEHAFSEPTPVSTGIRGQKGTRKSPSFVNAAFAVYSSFFWDGRADSLEAQALGPIANPLEMGHTHEAMVAGLAKIAGYRPYFEEAFGSEEVTKERVAKAIADYERTRLSGNSAWDRWRRKKDASAVSDAVKQGDELFFGKAACSQCHVTPTFSDSLFHNLGVGWDAKKKDFADPGRFAVTKQAADKGAFKTPGLRDVSKHAPYVHDGSLATLRDTVLHYDKGGNKNPHLSPRIKPLGLKPEEVDALVAFMRALDGEGYLDQAPRAFPQ